VALALLLATAPALAQDRVAPASREQVRLSFAPVVKRTAPAVVNIYSRRVVREQNPFANNPFFQEFFRNFGGQTPFGLPQERIEQSLGSGVIVRPDGLIVTNHHVVRQSDSITVVLPDRREFEARVVRADERADLAVLRIAAGAEALPHLEFGDSDAVEVGDLVLAIGNPFGVGQTVTSGIVSAVARSIQGGGDMRSFIQTDAAINTGNSGGALIGLDGRLVGVNTMILSRSGGSIGLGFAIPSNLVRGIVDAAAGGGRLVRPWLGAAGQSVTADMAQPLGLARPVGVVLNEVLADGPAARAGLRQGDVVLAIDGREVEDDAALNYRVATARVGQSVTVAFQRQGRAQTVRLELRAPPETPPRDERRLDGPHPFAGATVVNLSPAVAQELGLRPSARGVLVTAVVAGGNAARVGVQPGDIVAQVNGRDIADVRALAEATATRQARWRLQLRRGQQLLTADVQG
jgi:serine protease Do